MKKKKWWLLYPVLALLLAFSVAVPALSANAQVVPMPHNFYGSLIIGTSPAPALTEVKAEGVGVMLGIVGNPITTTEVGQYGGPGPTDPKLKVMGYIDEGTPIEFYIDGVRAQCRVHGTVTWLDSYPWHSDGLTELDLRVEIVPPEVTTAAATDVTTESATLNGSLDDLGDYSPVNVSFEWGTTSGGPYPNETTPSVAMTSTGAFSAPISGLSSDTTYYFRAKGTGSITVYGDELSFTTEKVSPEITTAAATDVTTESATLNGSLDDLGDYSPVDVSFEWGTTSGALDQETTPSVAMTSTGAFSAPISGLASNTTYYFRAKGTGSITVYGEELNFTTETEVGAPEVTTAAATDVTTGSATLNGSLDDLGDYTTVDVSFEWGTTSGGPYPNETTPPVAMTSTGAFTANLSSLSSDTTYYFRAKATGSITVYGDELSFTTEKVSPEVTTAAATDVSTESATLNGSLDNLGDYSPVDVSFEWGTTSGGPYPNETTPPVAMTSTGAFTAPISGLVSNTTYYFRAKGTGSITVYGSELSFTTLPSPPLMYLSLSSGWNTFSTPIALDPDSNTWDDLLALSGLGDDVEDIYYYNGSTQYWGPVTTGYVVNPLDGFYVNLSDEGLGGAVPIIPNPMATPPPAKELFAGLNLIGPASLVDRDVVSSLIDVYEVTGGLTGYSRVLNPPINVPNDFVDDAYVRDDLVVPTMVVGDAYWGILVNPGTVYGFTSTPLEP